MDKKRERGMNMMKEVKGPPVISPENEQFFHIKRKSPIGEIQSHSCIDGMIDSLW
jgi:hypothetical protein